MLYTGIDLIEIARVERAARRWGQRFLVRVFMPSELADCGLAAGGGAARWPSLAARWAAKEAAAKALGVGLRGLGAGAQTNAVGLREIEVRRDATGRPVVMLHGQAAARAEVLGLGDLALSLSHSGNYAIASVVALARSVPF